MNPGPLHCECSALPAELRAHQKSKSIPELTKDRILKFAKGSLWREAMKVKVLVGREEREVEVKEGASVAEVLEALGINREEVIVKLGGTIVTEEEPLEEGSRIELIRVISGG